MDIKTDECSGLGNITPSEVFEELVSRNIVDEFYQNVWGKITEKSAYRQIKESPMNHLLSSAFQPDHKNPRYDEELYIQKLDSAKIGLLAITLEHAVADEVKNKMRKFPHSIIEGIIRDILKKKLSKTEVDKEKLVKDRVTPKGTNHVSSSPGLSKSVSVSPQSKNKTESDKMVFQRLHYLSSGSALSLEHISQFVTEINIREESTDYSDVNVTENIKKSTSAVKTNVGDSLNVSMSYENKPSGSFSAVTYAEDNLEDKDSSLLSEIESISSVSSVHTSELSSFDDAISISSDDESGGRRRKSIPLKKATELLLPERLSFHKDSQRKTHLNPKNKLVMNALNHSSGDDSTPTKRQRNRKPNPKYDSEDIVHATSPIKAGKTVKQKLHVEPSIPRKRGRPRKIT